MARKRNKKRKSAPAQVSSDVNRAVMSVDEEEPSENTAGIVCQRCKSSSWRVADSRPGEGTVNRIRICRCCGKRIPTLETPL